jgi:hypothetical protein
MKNLALQTKHAWCEITQAYDSNLRRAIRLYRVRCRCGAESSYHATGMSDEQLKKVFMRRKWDLAKHNGNHRCPDCVARAEPVAPPAPAPKKEPIIFCSFCLACCDARRMFPGFGPPNTRICHACVTRFAREIEPASPPQQVEPAPLPQVIAFIEPIAKHEEPAPAIAQEQPQADQTDDDNDDDEPADWWLELQAAKGRR